MGPSPQALRALARRDSLLGAAMKRVPPFPDFPRAYPARTHYHALARAIVYQQLATPAAATIHRRVVRLTPGSGFPTPPQVDALPDDELRGAGLSRAKLAALRDLTARVLSGALPLRSIARRPDEEVIEALTEVRGIGVWSAQMFLIFRLGRLDVLPTGDLGVQEGLRRLDGLRDRPRPAELEARGAVWAPVRSVASWVLWRLTDTDPD